MESITALRAGTRLEEYEIESELGHGGFGITYLATDTNLGKRVALKEYLPRDFATRGDGSTVVPNSSAEAADYEWGLKRFLDEARTLARFDHPHVNKVQRYFEANGTAYLVLEYIDGQTLGALLDKYPTVSESHLHRIMYEVLSGLEEVHGAGYVHRDLKPGNLMTRPDGSVVILDFGAARQAVGQRSKSITSIVTPGYAPIEQYDTKAEDVGPWSDLYALGMVAYRCVSGLREADLPDAVTRARHQRKGEPDLSPAAEMGKGNYEARFLQAIDWAIQVNEEDRPQSATAWRAAFFDGRVGRLAQPQSSSAFSSLAPAEQSAAESAPPSRLGRVSKAILAVVGVAVLGMGAWLLYPGMKAVNEPVAPRPAAPSAEPPPADPVAEWASVQATDTSAAYRQFIERYPNSPLSKLAKKRLAEQD